MTVVFFDLKMLSSHFPKSWTKLHFFVNVTKITDSETYIKTNYMMLIFLLLEKAVEEIKPHFVPNNFFFENIVICVILHEMRQSERKNKLVGCLNIIWRCKRFACWVIKYESTSLICAMYSLI